MNIYCIYISGVFNINNHKILIEPFMDLKDTFIN